MSGRRIRWANAGRAAAIAAAVLAGLATLPALLGEDKPPPLPEDVGLAGVAPAPPPPMPPAPVTPPEAAMRAPMGAARDPAAGGAARRESAGRRGRHDDGRRDDGGRGAGRRRGDSQSGAEATAPAYVPSYVPPVPATSLRSEFQIEG